MSDKILAGQVHTRSERGQTEQFDLFRGESLRIGRLADNDIVVNDTRVSRYHAVLTASATGILLSDLGSLNGSFLNERPIRHPVALTDDDIVLIGDTFLSVTTPRKSAHPGTLEVVETQLAKMRDTVVTILVADVCGYTSLIEEGPTAAVTAMLQSWLALVTDIVEQHGGCFDKYMGDAVMALWHGSRSEATKAAHSALAAARKIISETEQLNASASWQSLGKARPWSCRVALNSGDALIGTIGGGGAAEFTVIGDTVNVTFRLENLAKQQGKLLVVGPDTAALLSPTVTLSSLGTHAVEGRKGTMEVFSPEL